MHIYGGERVQESNRDQWVKTRTKEKSDDSFVVFACDSANIARVSTPSVSPPLVSALVCVSAGCLRQRPHPAIVHATARARTRASAPPEPSALSHCCSISFLFYLDMGVIVFIIL